MQIRKLSMGHMSFKYDKLTKVSRKLRTSWPLAVRERKKMNIATNQEVKSTTRHLERHALHQDVESVI